jgi:hypothetical protein
MALILAACSEVEPFSNALKNEAFAYFGRMLFRTSSPLGSNVTEDLLSTSWGSRGSIFLITAS